MQEELDLLDRVRFLGPFATSPCMQKLAASVNDTGCGRPFIGEYSMEPEKTKVSEFDAEFGLPVTWTLRSSTCSTFFLCALCVGIWSFLFLPVEP